MKKQTPQKPSSGNFFQRYGGRMTTGQLNQFLNRMTMYPWEKEYVKRVFERYHHPTSPHITEKEFKSALEEMAKNTKDPVQIKRIKELKKRFGF